MLKIEWSSPAIQDLKAAGDYITRDNPRAAKEMAGRVLECVEYLLDQPNLGRPGRLSGTREMVVSGTPFIVVYRIRGGVVQILRLLHHARLWP